jgi:UPF0042 nucleotide-binding protein
MAKEIKKTPLLLISGVSGAGKTTLAHVAEEKGFYVVEDLPTSIIPALLDCFKKDPKTYTKVALVVSIENAESVITLVKNDSSFELLSVGLDCSFASLMNRYRLTRHIHPLQPKEYSLEDAIKSDASLMESARPSFDIFIDTSGLNEKDLRKIATNTIGDENGVITVIFSSFGYKYGLPLDAEIVLDARVLANPYWVPSLSRLTGIDQPVIDYIDKDKRTKPFMNQIVPLVDNYIKSAIEEGRNFLNVDIGCSGGQHRSVYVAQHLYDHFSKRYHCVIVHRELSRYIDDEKA